MYAIQLQHTTSMGSHHRPLIGDGASKLRVVMVALRTRKTPYSPNHSSCGTHDKWNSSLSCVNHTILMTKMKLMIVVGKR